MDHHGQIWALKADSLTSPLTVTVTDATVSVTYVGMLRLNGAYYGKLSEEANRRMGIERSRDLNISKTAGDAI